MKLNTKRIIIALTFIAAILIANFSSISNYLTFQNFKLHTTHLIKIVNNNYATSACIYTLLYFVASILMLPVIAILLIAGGFLFGIISTCIYVNVGCTLGATISFLISRYILGNKIQEKYKNKLEKFNKNFKENGAFFLLAIRFIPILPFFLPNLLAGLTNLRLLTFVWTTSLGIIPASIVYAFAGNQLHLINNPYDIISYKILLIFLLLIFLATLPIFFNKIRNKN
ncbi:TVP38/TMEM64 family protein [Candidatus Babeliales bacterium]|nr:TVP38/TMEM64 family protein [Candidatus Babeliales bacterium]